MITGSLKQRGEREYRLMDKLSSSDIRKYATDGRRVFYKKVILRENEDKTYNRSMLIGMLTHCLLLDKHNFDKKFYASVCGSVPTGNMLNFVEALYKYTKLNMSDGVVNKKFAELAELAYKESGYKREGLESVIKKFKGKDPENYYRELRDCEGTGKEVVCIEDVNIAERITNTALSHDFTRHIFLETANKICFNEVQIDDFSIGGIDMKAMIDRIEIDTKEKYIQPYDVKVIWDNENFYREYFLKKRADIQAFIYETAIKSTNMSMLLEMDLLGYEVKPIKFITLDSTNFNSPLIYPMTGSLMRKAYRGFIIVNHRYPGIKEIIEEISWHKGTGDWTTSMAAHKDNGLTTLNDEGL